MAMELMTNSTFIINENTKIIKSLSKLEKSEIKCLIVIDKNKKVKGTLTDGDVRRAILKGRNFSETIKNIYNKKFKFYYENNYNLKLIGNILEKKENHIELVPILKKNKTLKKIYKLENFLDIKKVIKKKTIDTKVIIMAGGLGKRLLPLTKNKPKPLVLFNNKTFLDIILENFFFQGFQNFAITLYHKKKMIQNHLKKNKKYNVEIINENKPLGTAGSLFFFKKKKEKYFLVTNCDNFYQVNYDNFLSYHKKFKYDLTIAVSKKTLKLPYGICKLKNEKFTGIVEKPEYSNFVNAGLYIFKRESFKYLKNKKIDMNDLIQLLKSKKYKIGIYPIDEKSWIDVGTLSRLNSELGIV